MTDHALGTAERPVRIAVVGSGPSGFYAIAALFKQEEFAVEVDLFDRLPTPFGLVRGGVAPDHQNIKAVVRVYDKLAARPEFRFCGNVKIGVDLTVDALAEHYDQIVFATGNEGERLLRVPGENLPGVHSATAFVGWYNGHPDYRDLEFDLAGCRRALVVGNGNVSMDVTRILAQDPDELASTDIAIHALEALRESTIEEIVVVGRRGAAQAAFTNKEIKEIGALESADLRITAEDAALDELSTRWLDQHPENSNARKNVEYLAEQAKRPPSGAAKRIELRLLVSPSEFIRQEGRLGAVRLERNELYEAGDGTPRPRGTGRCWTEDFQIAFTAVGYRGLPIPGVAFDEKRGVLANLGGRITDESGAIQPGRYVVGWAKRGPRGLIGSNVADSNETVSLMLEDLREGAFPAAAKPSREAIDRRLADDGLTVVSYDDWKRLDVAEVERGKAAGKVREKFTSVREMMDVLASPSD